LKDNYYKNKYVENIDESLNIVIDATGFTISKDTYIEDKWKKKRRKYLKFYIAVDIKSK